VAALGRAIKSYTRSLTTGSVLARKSQEHGDNMIVWATGLMGAGLFALPAFLKAACASAKGRLLPAAIPWVVGVVLSVLARVASGIRRDQDDFFLLQKRAKLDWLLLTFLEAQGGGTITMNGLVGFRDSFLMIMRDEDKAMARRSCRMKVLHVVAEGLYYVSLAAFMGAIVVTFWLVARCAP